MKTSNRLRGLSGLATYLVILSSLLPFLRLNIANAYGLVNSRSITLSSGAPSASSVTYKVAFNFATTGNVQGIVVDFCDNDAIIGDTTCTAPGGFSITASPAVSGQSTTSGCSLAGFTTAGELNTNRTLTLTAASAVNVTSTPCAASFNITTVTNPNTANHTFYARIYTYATASAATSYTVAAPGSYIDAGGIALSTSQSITVTAKVQEQLTFCVGTLSAIPSSGGTPTAQTSCGSLPNSAVTLGNNDGVLSSAGPYVDTSTQYIVGTNAQGGAAIVLRGNTLTSGSGATIAGIGTGTGTPAVSAAGSSQFGICTYVGTGSNLVFTGDTTYADATCTSSKPTQSAGYASSGGAGTAKFGFNTTNTTSAGGDDFATENAGANSTGIVNIMGNIPTTQVAGVYTTNLNFIATGTY